MKIIYFMGKSGAARALKEGNPNYPVPVIWEEEQMRAFLMEQVPK